MLGLNGASSLSGVIRKGFDMIWTMLIRGTSYLAGVLIQEIILEGSKERGRRERRSEIPEVKSELRNREGRGQEGGR